MTASLSKGEARRIALAAQGFGRPHPGLNDMRQITRLLARLGLHQIDSVNVLTRAHYLPAFSRLGTYDRALIDRAAWGRPADRRMFEYWGHEASLMPLALHPLLRWRMTRADRGEAGWQGLRVFARERRGEAEAVLARIRAHGPVAAADFEDGRSRAGWWEWGESKRVLEWLFWAGHITTRTRRGAFERVYDLSERVIPSMILALPTPDEADAITQLVAHAARALGVATSADLRDYFRLPPAETRAAIDRLTQAGELIPVEVAGWGRPAYLHRDSRRPRRVVAQALLAPFDPLIWERARTERLFGFRYRIGIYTPADRREHGYYPLPFLVDEAIVARVDLKADRQAGRLVVKQLSLEADAPADTMERLGAELARMAGWLGLEAPPRRTAFSVC